MEVLPAQNSTTLITSLKNYLRNSKLRGEATHICYQTNTPNRCHQTTTQILQTVAIRLIPRSNDHRRNLSHMPASTISNIWNGSLPINPQIMLQVLTGRKKQIYNGEKYDQQIHLPTYKELIFTLNKHRR